jgi:hypothetical protein
VALFAAWFGVPVPLAWCTPRPDPALQLNHLGAFHTAPAVLRFPSRGKLRIGGHPAAMDSVVGDRAFSRLPVYDVHGLAAVDARLPAHAACIWRDPRTDACYIQLGWPGPGQVLTAPPFSQVFHLGRPQDASSAPLRLHHHDVIRLAAGVEYVFHEAGARLTPAPRTIVGGPSSHLRIVPARNAPAPVTHLATWRRRRQPTPDGSPIVEA